MSDTAIPTRRFDNTSVTAMRAATYQMCPHTIKSILLPTCLSKSELYSTSPTIMVNIFISASGMLDTTWSCILRVHKYAYMY